MSKEWMHRTTSACTKGQKMVWFTQSHLTQSSQNCQIQIQSCQGCWNGQSRGNCQMQRNHQNHRSFLESEFLGSELSELPDLES